MTKHNKHYYEEARNGWTPTKTWDNPKAKENKINPKMLLSKEELNIPKKKSPFKFDWHLDKTVERIVKLLKEKNEAYGNTALNPANIFSSLDSVEAICARIDDKLSRIKNRGINDKTEDTVDDLIGYLLLLKMSMEK